MARRDSQWRGVPWVTGPDIKTPIYEANHSSPRTLTIESGNSLKDPVRVSGWWTIDVTNPDGSAAAHQEFENNFSGGQTIVDFLAGVVVPGEASIHFGAGMPAGTRNAGDAANFNTSPCFGTSGCLISQIPGGWFHSSDQCKQNSGSCSTTLIPSIVTVNVVVSDNPGDNNMVPSPALELNGQITAQQDQAIGYLESNWSACNATGGALLPATVAPTNAAPAACAAAGGGVGLYTLPMTFLYLGNQISVTAGQIIHIKIDIAFTYFFFTD